MDQPTQNPISAWDFHREADVLAVQTLQMRFWFLRDAVVVGALVSVSVCLSVCLSVCVLSLIHI